MAAAKELVIGMLAQGIGTQQIAAAVGVDPSYVSQIAADPRALEQVEVLQGELTEKDRNFDDKLEEGESEYLDRIVDKAKFANLQQSLQAFKVLNGARRRKDGRMAGASQLPGVIVPVVLPVMMVPQYKMNSQAEIVEVEGKTMVSASPQKLEAIRAMRNNGNTGKANQLPGITKVERAAGVLEKLDNKPARKQVKQVSLVDLL